MEFIFWCSLGSVAIITCSTEYSFIILDQFEKDEDAVEMANCTEYGLAGSVWTSDSARGKSLAEKIETGMVWINTWLHRDLRVPFGGVKNSGVGTEGGRWSLSFFSQPVNICVKE